MPAIATLADLKSAAAIALVRADFAEPIASAVPLAEAWLNRSLRLRMMESDEALAVTPGSSTVALPAGFLEPIELLLVDARGRTPLIYTPRGFQAVRAPSRPRRWTIEGDIIRFAAPADGTYPLALRMYKRFGLAADGESNGLLTAWADLYLYALLVAVCATYLTDDPRLGVWKAGRDELLDEIKRKEGRGKALAELRVDSSLIQQRIDYCERSGS